MGAGRERTVYRRRFSAATIRRLKIVALCVVAVVVYVKGSEFFAVWAFRIFLRTFPASIVVALLVVGYWRHQFNGR